VQCMSRHGEDKELTKTRRWSLHIPFEKVVVEFNRIIIEEETITVIILCPNSPPGKPHEILFKASYHAKSQIPTFTAIHRCPVCRQYFLDEDDNCCSIEPAGGVSVAQWWYRLDAIKRRVEEVKDKEIEECFMETVRIPILKRTSEKSGKKREKAGAYK